MTMRPLVLSTLLAATLVTTARAADAPQTTWVAVASDGRRNFGYAVGMGTREAAEITALGQCGNGCSVMLTAVARCVAYARSGPGDAIGFSAGATLEAVRQDAWADCNRRVPANSCTVRAAQCYE